MSQKLELTIRNSEEILFQGEAASISSSNEQGPFDILPLHANFISIIKKTIVIHHANGSKKELTIDSGVLKAAENVVDVFVGIETTSEVV